MADLVLPGMTTKQLIAMLPPQRQQQPADGKLQIPIVTLWNGQSFYMTYPLDHDFYVAASGTGRGESAEVLESRPCICKRPDIPAR